MDSLLLLAQQAENVGGGDVSGGLLLGGGVMLIVALVLGALALILWIWALIDAIQNPALSSNERIVWILVIVLTNWLGAVIYLLIGRNRSVAGRT